MPLRHLSLDELLALYKRHQPSGAPPTAAAPHASSSASAAATASHQQPFNYALLQSSAQHQQQQQHQQLPPAPSSKKRSRSRTKVGARPPLQPPSGASIGINFGGGGSDDSSWAVASASEHEAQPSIRRRKNPRRHLSSGQAWTKEEENAISAAVVACLKQHTNISWKWVKDKSNNNTRTVRSIQLHYLKMRRDASLAAGPLTSSSTLLPIDSTMLAARDSGQERDNSSEEDSS